MAARPKKTILWCQYALLVVGFSALGYCAFVFGMEGRYQGWAREQMAKASSEPAASLTAETAEAAKQHEPGAEGAAASPVGRIDIPRVHLSALVAEGTSAAMLRVAVGHVPGTARPGKAGNIALAAHRDTFFRGLGELRPGDIIRLTVPGKQYVYSVTFSDVVGPDETWVLGPTSHEALTLITCYPFHFIGPAPKRFVVRARRLEGE